MTMGELLQMSFDYSLLTEDQARRTQDAEVRIIGRTQRTIVENGRDLLAVKKDIGHGNFMNWVQSLGISIRTADRWMSVVENFGQIGPEDQFENHALYLLSSPKVSESAREEAKERAASGEKITEEIARQIRDAHKAKEEAEEAERQARAEAHMAQQRLFEAQTHANTQIESLNEQIAGLEQQMQSLTTPQEKIIQEDTPETKAQLSKLQAMVDELTTQRDNLSRENEELSADLDVVEAKREEEARILRVRQEWQRSADAMHKSVVRFMGQLPMALDTQLFESDDWAMLDQVVETFHRGIEACRNVRRSTSNMVIDAG